VARPVVDPDYTATVGLDRDQARALVAADADTGAQALRTTAVVRLLLHNPLRVDEACAADLGLAVDPPYGSPQAGLSYGKSRACYAWHVRQSGEPGFTASAQR